MCMCTKRAGGRLCRRPAHAPAGAYRRSRGRQGVCRPDPAIEFRCYLPERIQLCYHHPLAHLLLASAFALNLIAQEGEFHARHEKFHVTVIVPKAFYNQSFEAEEVAKELAKKIKAEEDAKEMAKKSAASMRATVSTTRKKTHQKPAKNTKTTEQATAPAPAKNAAPVTTHQWKRPDPPAAVTACSLDLYL